MSLFIGLISTALLWISFVAHFLFRLYFHTQEANLNLSAKNEKSASPVQAQAERDLDNYKELQLQAIQKLEQQMKKQVRIENRSFQNKFIKWTNLDE